MTVRSRLTTVGLVTLVLGLVIFFPARVAYHWFAPQSVSLAGIEGSIWSGSAREAQASGIYLRDVVWRMRPLALFSGKLGYELKASPSGGFVEGKVGLGIGGSVLLSDLKAALSLQELQQSTGIPGLNGKVNANFERLLLEDGIPLAADGVLEVADLVAPMILGSSIGGYRAEFFTQESGVMASVEDTNGIVDLAGSLQISSDGDYQFIAQLAAKNSTPAILRQQMALLGSANERGQRELRLEGKL